MSKLLSPSVSTETHRESSEIHRETTTALTKIYEATAEIAKHVQLHVLSVNRRMNLGEIPIGDARIEMERLQLQLDWLEKIVAREKRDAKLRHQVAQNSEAHVTL